MLGYLSRFSDVLTLKQSPPVLLVLSGCPCSLLEPTPSNPTTVTRVKQVTLVEAQPTARVSETSQAAPVVTPPTSKKDGTQKASRIEAWSQELGLKGQVPAGP